MSSRTAQLPGPGFWILLVSYTALVGFVYFGSRKPRLDEVFEILQKRELGDSVTFTEQDVQVLAGALGDHSGFSRALVGKASARFLEPRPDGWLRRAHAHLAVCPQKAAPLQLRFESEGRIDDYPLTVNLQGMGFAKSLKLLAGIPEVVELSATDIPQAGILECSIKGARDSVTGRPSWGLRVVSPVTATNREVP